MPGSPVIALVVCLCLALPIGPGSSDVSILPVKPAGRGLSWSALAVHGSVLPAPEPTPAITCPNPGTIARPLQPGERVQLPILMYHHLAVLPAHAGPALRQYTVSPRAFEEQMAYLATHDYHAIYVADLIDYFDKGRPLPANPVLITFDDAWEEQYSVAFPILRKYCLVGTFFVPTATTGKSDTVLSWEQIEEMDRAGMEFGSHTVDHSVLTRLSQAQVMDQLVRSKLALEQHLSRQVVAFSYPNGAYNTAITRWVEQAGYGAAVEIHSDLYQRKRYRYELRRMLVPYNMTLAVFTQRLGTPSGAPPAPPHP